MFCLCPNCLVASFELDTVDYNKLIDAKTGELMKAGVTYPEFDVARNAITLVELARHCKQKTRGTGQTIKLLEELILTMLPATDP